MAADLSPIESVPAPQSAGVLALIERALPAQVRASADELRRGRVFLAIWFLLTFAAWFFAWAIAQTTPKGIPPNGIALIIGGVLSILNLPLAHWLKSIRLPGRILTAELAITILLLGWTGSGPGDGSQWFLMLVPLIGAFLVGGTAGLLFAGICIAGTIGLFVAKDVMHLPFGGRDDNADWFDLMGACFVLGIAALIAYSYEAAQRSSLTLVGNALRELQGKNVELEKLAKKVAEARDLAVEESTRKSEFLVQMRTFSDAQGQALERTRMATSQLSDTIRAISTSVETLATSSAASDSTVDGMAETAARTSQTAQNLVLGVEETNRALQALTSAVAAVQAQYDDLRSSASSTAAAMLEMEESAARVEQRAVRTVGLSDAMIKDAERGQEAVRRTLAGVDDIRANARLAGDVIRQLDARVAAIGAINSVIDEVAVETNVLALNASIIAAQAGESGQGFAVVADQMRALAARTAVSTREISSVIRAVQSEAKNAVDAIEKGESAVEAGVTMSEDAARALEQIVASAREATEEVRNIEQATMSQAKRARDVGGAMGEVTRLVADAVMATAEHGRSANQIESTMQKLRAIAPDLDQRSRQQADGARSARAAIARISDMAKRLSSVQGDQQKASDQTLRAIEEIQKAQRGQDDALRRLGD
ncbi:MAG TPA: methyl-accepting chemotaxis protein [Myxococcota bacterium]